MVRSVMLYNNNNNKNNNISSNNNNISRLRCTKNIAWTCVSENRKNLKIHNIIYYVLYKNTVQDSSVNKSARSLSYTRSGLSATRFTAMYYLIIIVTIWSIIRRTAGR